MEHSAALIAIFHVLIALLLIVVVLLQDSKGGGASGVFGGGSSQSIFGATGGTTFLVKLTRFLAMGFMVTCIVLTVLASSKSNRSVIDSVTTPNTAVPVAPAQQQASPAAK